MGSLSLIIHPFTYNIPVLVPNLNVLPLHALLASVSSLEAIFRLASSALPKNISRSVMLYVVAVVDVIEPRLTGGIGMITSDSPSARRSAGDRIRSGDDQRLHVHRHDVSTTLGPVVSLIQTSRLSRVNTKMKNAEASTRPSQTAVVLGSPSWRPLGSCR